MALIALSLSWHWERGPYSWSRVATFGRRGQLAPQLGVFFREALQLHGRVRLVLSTFGLRIEYSVFNAIIVIVIIIILLAFERRVESRRRRRCNRLVVMLVLTVGRIE